MKLPATCLGLIDRLMARRDDFSKEGLQTRMREHHNLNDSDILIFEVRSFIFDEALLLNLECIPRDDQFLVTTNLTVHYRVKVI